MNETLDDLSRDGDTTNDFDTGQTEAVATNNEVGQTAETLGKPNNVPAIRIAKLVAALGQAMIDTAGIAGTKGQNADKLMERAFGLAFNMLRVGQEIGKPQARLFKDTLERAQQMYLDAGADRKELADAIDVTKNTVTYLILVATEPEPEPIVFPKPTWLSAAKAGDPKEKRKTA